MLTIKMRYLLVVLMLWAAPAWGAVYFSGNDLQTDCQKDSPISQGLCLGYILAASDTFDLYDEQFPKFKNCTPKSVTAGQLIGVVKNWLADNPQHRHHSAPSLVLKAIKEAWPCP